MFQFGKAARVVSEVQERRSSSDQRLLDVFDLRRRQREDRRREVRVNPRDDSIGVLYREAVVVLVRLSGQAARWRCKAESGPERSEKRRWALVQAALRRPKVAIMDLTHLRA